MNVKCTWNEKLLFTAESNNHLVKMDARLPLGGDAAMTPKELVLAGLCGCTAMDVVSLLKKYKQPVENFEIDAEAEMTDQGHPVIFREVKLRFRFKGVLDAAKTLEAVTLSQTKFCGVSAMIAKAAPIRYTVEVNDAVVGTGEAKFA